MKASLVTFLSFAAVSIAACGPSAPPPPPSAAHTDPQIAQLVRLADAPASIIEDSLFILWEYDGALRERALAEAVLAKTMDPQIRALATIVRDGHQAGMDAMKAPAADLGITLPTGPSALDTAAIAAAAALPTTRLDDFFIRRQRAMHAWDVTAFDDYRSAAVNPKLKAYVAATRAPLRDHATEVNRVARIRGLAR